MQISITRALNEVKLLEKRINNKIENSQFIIANKQSNKKINGADTIEQFKNSAKADYESSIDLIERKKSMKTSIVESNAITKLEIGEYQYSVADAIERKKSISLDIRLLNVMKQQYARALVEVTNKNEQMEVNLDRQLETMLGSEGKKSDGADAYAKQYRETNSFELIDGLELKEKIQALEEEINEFLNNVDFCLSESNALTKIEISE
ncbi:hypothetical protein [Clostridium tagluense]|uniref:Uncharacterized protein n=1 Tax=Clostridium tagluense TaxID=360422 RepID=A0A401ULK3_9CLOT|nr:hypothetical protein [Clostridium tagluense]GCD10414.1 hypothetical protein Ctaglu_20370 [Clostridium tagluense]